MFGPTCPMSGILSIWVCKFHVPAPPNRLINSAGHCWSDEAFHPALNAHDNTTYYNGSVTYIHPSKNPACNHGYALTRSGARRILVHLRYPPFAYSRAIDLAITWLIRSNRIKSFSLYPSIVIQRKTSNSDIMPGTGSDWKDTLVNGVFSVSEKDAPK